MTETINRLKTVSVASSSGSPRPLMSQAVCVPPGSSLVFISGQVAQDSQGRVVGADDMAAQFVQVLSNVGECLKAAKCDFENIVKITTYVTDFEAFRDCRDIRLAAFGDAPPASSTVEVKALAHDEFMIEMEVIAAQPA